MFDKMKPGGSLTPGSQMMTSIAIGVDKYIFTLQFDGNLVLYKQSGLLPVKREALWASQTVGFETNKLDLQEDGNVVIYDIHDLPQWATNTAGS